MIDMTDLMPPELAPYAQDLEEFKLATGIKLLFPPLGMGGGGTVLAAQDTHGNTLAIKVIAADDATSRDQALREASILKQVQHAAALGGQGLLWEKHYHKLDLFFLAMDFISGQTLAQLIASRGSLTEPLALELVLAIAEALEALHRQQIIHRDIKPDNVMMLKLGSRYQPIVVDYGIAKVGNRTARGARAATDGYAPPEQYKGGTDRRTDGYALGATLYEMVTGQTPPLSTTRHPNEPLEPRQINPAISLELELVIQIATAYYPHQRFPNMGAIIDALRLVQAKEKVALLGMLQAMGLLTASGNDLLHASATPLASIPPLPPLPLKQQAPKPGAKPAAPAGKYITCPYCRKRCQPGEDFCDDCGSALHASVKAPSAVQPVAALSQVAAAPAAAPAVPCTPGPQFISLLFAGQIILGGPALAKWEKILLLLAYWVMLSSVALGGRSVSIACLSSGFAIGFSVLFLLLFSLFARLLVRWEKTAMTRRGLAKPLRRSIVLLLSLAGLLGMLYWFVREVMVWQGAWLLNPPDISIVLYVGLACCASILIEALLA